MFSKNTDNQKIPLIHPFPARMAPSIAYDVLKTRKTPLRVLDPMVGSGTTTYIARICGHNSYGFDIDPLSVLISKSLCTSLQPDLLIQTAQMVIGKSRKAEKTLSNSQAYPRGADEETKEYVDYWFDLRNKRQLAVITDTIHDLTLNRDLKLMMWTILSGTIITKKIGTSLAADVSHSRPHKIYEEAPIEAFELFLKRASRVGTLISLNPTFTYEFKPIIKKADARKIPVNNESIDIVITSPPYINAIDYIRGHKLSLVWIGYTLKQIRSVRQPVKPFLPDDTINKIATKSVFDSVVRSSTPNNLVKQYVSNMSRVISEISRILSYEGKAVFVLGNPTVNGELINSALIFEALCSLNSLELLEKTKRIIPENRRYLPAPSYLSLSSPLKKRMSEEIILTFTKPKRKLSNALNPTDTAIP